MTEKQAEIPIGPFTTITVDIGDQPIPKTAEKQLNASTPATNTD